MEQKNKTKYEYLYPWLPGNAPEDLSDEQLLKDFLFYKIQYVDGDRNSNEIKDKLFDLKDEIINADPSYILSKFLKYQNESNIKKIMKEAFKYSFSFNKRKDFWNSEAIKNLKFLE